MMENTKGNGAITKVKIIKRDAALNPLLADRMLAMIATGSQTIVNQIKKGKNIVQMIGMNLKGCL